jgi:hypothetical protein
MLALALSVAAGAFCAVGVAACGEGGSDSTVAVEEADEIEVGLTEFDIDVDPVRVREGVIEVVARNEGERDHVLAVGDLEGELQRTRRLKPEESDAIKVDFRPGRYDVYDPLADHRERGMAATIIVRPRTKTVTATDGATQTEVQTEPRIVTVTQIRDRTVVRTVTRTETVTVTVPRPPSR